VFVDGPHHDTASQHERDELAAERLENLGWVVVRVRHDDDWPSVLTTYEWIFGKGAINA